MKSICVFAGSNTGHHPNYAEQARVLGRKMAERNIKLIYGGSRIGLMGEVADTVLRCGGEAVGVMPEGLFKGEMAHTGLTEFILVKDMHERKATMGRLADGYIALPGGFGTFEEWFEVLSWAQLGIHEKPVALLNIEDYYTPIIQLLHQAIEAGFAHATHEQLVLSDGDAEQLLDKMAAYRRPEFGNKWSQLEASSC